MITVSQYLEMKSLDVNHEDYDISLIKLVFPHLDPLEMSVEEFSHKLNQINDWVSNRHFSADTINGKPIRKSLQPTFGEYIDLEKYIVDDLERFLKRFLGYSDFYDFPVQVLFRSMDIFMEYQREMLEDYAALFDYTPLEDEDKEFSRSATLNFEINDKGKNQKKWSWLLIAFNLAKNDINQLEGVFNQDMGLVLNILLMAKELEIQINPIYNPAPLY